MQNISREKTAGEKLEGIAFTFCKVATVALLAQKYTLPIASGAAAIFYVLSYAYGKKDTRCILASPLLIAAFWSAVCVAAIFVLVRAN